MQINKYIITISGGNFYFLFLQALLHKSTWLIEFKNDGKAITLENLPLSLLSFSLLNAEITLIKPTYKMSQFQHKPPAD